MSVYRPVIRPANKKVPYSQKTSNHTNRYKSSINQKSHPPKCTNSINLFENFALSPKEIYPRRTSLVLTLVVLPILISTGQLVRLPAPSHGLSPTKSGWLN